MKHRIPLFLTAGAVIAAAVGIVAFSNISPKRETPSSPTFTPKPVLTSSPNIPTAVPVVPVNARGTVVVRTDTTLTLTVDGKAQTFSIKTTQDIQRLTSGSLETGGVQTAKATLSDIQAGQEVYVVTDKNTGYVVSILILR